MYQAQKGSKVSQQSDEWQRQVDLCEFVYRASSKTARAIGEKKTLSPKKNSLMTVKTMTNN